MVAFGPGISCRDAEPYYYDYLCGLEASVPQVVVDHIRHCADCKTEVRRLEAAVGESEVEDCDCRDDADVAGTLGLHFAHIGEKMTCAKAKSFLPMLLVPSLQIRIPTPVTVHVDHCPQCTEDLESLRGLELRPEQLARLSRLYAAIADNDSHMCRRARAKTWAFACSSFDGIGPEVLDHMCVCPRCRRRVYRRREKILLSRQPGDTISGVGLCNGISTADLFEWVVPYGRGDDGEPTPARDEAVPSHLRACPECVEKMQALHRTLYGIAERVDSGVSTVYSTAGTAVEASDERTESLYCGYPIHVEVSRRDREPTRIRFEPIAHIRKALQWTPTPQFKQVMKVAFPAAAVIVLGITLFVSTRSASGLREQQLTDTIRGIENLHITRYAGDGARLVEEHWVARGAGLAVIHNWQANTLYDFNGREKVIRRAGGSAVERTPLTQDDQGAFERNLDAVLRQAMSGTPVDEGLSPLTSDADEDIGQGSVVCEQPLEDRLASNGLVLHRRLRSFLDPVTGLPRGTKQCETGPGETLWHLVQTRVFEYPSRQEAEAAIRGALSE